MKISTLGLPALGLLMFAATASADLMTNGGFETGDLSGWTASGQIGGIFVCGVGDTFACNHLGGFTSSGAPHSGGNALAFGPEKLHGGGIAGSIQQTLTTVALQSYDISFWVETCPDLASCNTNDLIATFGGTTLISLSNTGPSLWHQFVFPNVTATAGSTVLDFSGDNYGGFFLIDDVSVTPHTSSPVPEPSALALLSTAAGAVGFLARRRRFARARRS
jgi:hypothetical protein